MPKGGGWVRQGPELKGSAPRMGLGVPVAQPSLLLPSERSQAPDWKSYHSYSSTDHVLGPLENWGMEGGIVFGGEGSLWTLC